MSQSQNPFFVKIKNVIMSDFIPLFEDTVSNILSLRCDKISRLHQALLLFQSLIDNKMDFSEECDLTVVLPTPKQQQHKYTPSPKINSTQHSLSQPFNVMFVFFVCTVLSQSDYRFMYKNLELKLTE